jgi:hypothetical protein
MGTGCEPPGLQGARKDVFVVIFWILREPGRVAL